MIRSTPPPSHSDLDREGLTIIEERGPTLLIDGTALVSGQVARVTSYENGFPVQMARGGDGGWEPDPWTWDDQNLVVKVRDCGLVIVSGCSHAGVAHCTGWRAMHALASAMPDAFVQPSVGTVFEFRAPPEAG